MCYYRKNILGKVEILLKIQIFAKKIQIVAKNENMLTNEFTKIVKYFFI